ncbi:MAG: DUF998 domain-containing protein [Bacteroidia bacterium]|nr:DUF998 domain-containing protein [Bacteroidia bacterium]
MKKPKNYIIISALACIIASAGEFLTMFVFTAFYPGYSNLKDTMSSLGASASPVSGELSAWWVIMGLLLIFFGTGFRKAFSEKGGYTVFASWLIMLYGLGEGIGSGVFKAEHVINSVIISGVFHSILGSIGVISILLLPIIMKKVISKNENPLFYRLSQIVFICGIITIFLFLFRYSPDENNIISIYAGLWQRLFMLNTYIYLLTIAVIMINRQKNHFHP